MEYDTYQENVFDYLEYLGYPEYITGFHPQSVAESLAPTMRRFYIGNMSFRLCALVIFGLTMTFQVMRANSVKH